MGRKRTGSVVEYRDAENHVRYKVGLTPPPPLKGRQKWWPLPVGTSEARADDTKNAWNDESATNPRKFFPELFESTRVSDDPTLAEHCALYFANRKARRNDDDKRAIEIHVLPVLGDRPFRSIRRADIFALIKGLEAEPVESKTKIYGKSIRNIYAILRAMWKRAVRADEDRAHGLPEAVILRNPCTLEAEDLPSVEELSPRSKVPGPYERNQAKTLLFDPRVEPDVQMLTALILLGGMRHGEAAGMRWRNYDPTRVPLGRLDLKTQYDGKPLKGKGPRGGNPREIPVHHVLADMLAEWKAVGFAKCFRRAPKPDDFMVPQRRTMKCRKPSASLDKFYIACRKVGVPKRREHDLRHTFVSLTRGDGARPDVLEAITHNARGGVFDSYTTWPWETLCEAVACLRIELPGAGPGVQGGQLRSIVRRAANSQTIPRAETGVRFVRSVR